VTTVTTEFEVLARAERQALGSPYHPLLVVEHPISTLTDDGVKARADAVFDRLIGLLVEA